MTIDSSALSYQAYFMHAQPFSVGLSFIRTSYEPLVKTPRQHLRAHVKSLKEDTVLADQA